MHPGFPTLRAMLLAQKDEEVLSSLTVSLLGMRLGMLGKFVSVKHCVACELAESAN